MDQAIAELNQKIDLLTTQVQFLTEQAKLAERQRQERAELVRDLTPIVNEVYRLSVEQLEEVEHYVDLNDLLRLLKRLLRNGRNIDQMLDQLESLTDLLDTVMPLSDAAFGKLVDLLQTMESKGYFAFASGGLQVLDNVVTSFGKEGMEQLNDNIVPVLQTVTAMTQPQVMGVVHNVVSAIGQEPKADVSLMALLRQMRDPDVRRGLAIALQVLRAIGVPAAG